MAASIVMNSNQYSSIGKGNLKRHIRSATRLLNRPNLPADVRRETERRLAALQNALQDKAHQELEHRMTVKYRMVKFFERKKALRKLAAAQASGNDEAVKAAQLDLAYIHHFPADRKYISLYPKTPSCEAVIAQREAIRKDIAEKLAILGAETMLAKVLKNKAADLQDSADDDEDEDEDEDSEDFESDDDEEDDEDDEEEDNEEDDDESEVDDEEDLDNEDDDEDDEDDEEDDEDDEEDEEDDFESEEDDEDFDSDDDEDDDEEEEDDEEDSEDDFESEEEEDDDDEEEEEDDEEPSPKKSRRN